MPPDAADSRCGTVTVIGGLTGRLDVPEVSRPGPPGSREGSAAICAVVLAVLDRRSECRPLGPGEGEDGAVRILAVADLDGLAGVAGLDAVALVRGGVAALGPVAGKGHRDGSLQQAHRFVDESAGCGRAHRGSPEMIEHHRVPMDVLGIVFDQATCRAVGACGDGERWVAWVE